MDHVLWVVRRKIVLKNWLDSHSRLIRMSKASVFWRFTVILVIKENSDQETVLERCWRVYG
jgi:hypothetical protein